MPRQHFFEQVEPAVGDAVMCAARELERLGAVLVDVDVPMAIDAHRHMTNMVFADACHVHRDRLENAPETITASVVERMGKGFSVTGLQYAEAIDDARRWRLALRRLFADVDLLLSPTTPMQAPPIEDGHNLLEATRAATRNTYARALGGIPGRSLPCRLTPDGLLVGLQLAAAWWREPLLLRAGCAYQRVTPFHTFEPPTRQRPPVTACRARPRRRRPSRRWRSRRSARSCAAR